MFNESEPRGSHTPRPIHNPRGSSVATISRLWREELSLAHPRTGSVLRDARGYCARSSPFAQGSSARQEWPPFPRVDFEMAVSECNSLGFDRREAKVLQLQATLP